MAKEEGVKKEESGKVDTAQNVWDAKFLPSFLAGTSTGTATQEKSVTLPPTLVTVE